MNLTIDIGNTQTKAAFFDNGNIVKKFLIANPEDLISVFLDNDIDYVIVSSVKGFDGYDNIGVPGKVFYLDHRLPLPFENNYLSPETLGMDRIAAVAGALGFSAKDHILVIDAGTCITYDFLDKETGYFGGSISPGLSMRFKAMNTFTQKLPLIKLDNSDFPLIGQDTKEAISSGVVNGTIAEIEGIVNRYRDKYQNIKIFFCGGDSVFFENKIKASIFVIPDLVLIGLNRILEYNVSKNK